MTKAERVKLNGILDFLFEEMLKREHAGEHAANGNDAALDHAVFDFAALISKKLNAL